MIREPKSDADVDAMMRAMMERIRPPPLSPPQIAHPSLKRPKSDHVRRQVLARDDNKCRMCGKDESQVGRLTLHHVKPKRYGGKRRVKNLLSFCRPCHDLVESAIAAAEGR